jgi:hypothetical protein
VWSAQVRPAGRPRRQRRRIRSGPAPVRHRRGGHSVAAATSASFGDPVHFAAAALKVAKGDFGLICWMSAEAAAGDQPEAHPGPPGLLRHAGFSSAIVQHRRCQPRGNTSPTKACMSSERCGESVLSVLLVMAVAGGPAAGARATNDCHFEMGASGPN